VNLCRTCSTGPAANEFTLAIRRARMPRTLEQPKETDLASMGVRPFTGRIEPSQSVPHRGECQAHPSARRRRLPISWERGTHPPLQSAQGWGSLSHGDLNKTEARHPPIDGTFPPFYPPKNSLLPSIFSSRDDYRMNDSVRKAVVLAPCREENRHRRKYGVRSTGIY